MARFTPPKISFHKKSTGKPDTAIVGIYAKSNLSKAATALDKDNDGLITHQLKKQKKFTGKAGQTLTLSLGKKGDFTSLILVGLGETDKLDPKNAEIIGGKLYSALVAGGVEAAQVTLDEEPDLVASIASGIALRAYYFDKYKTADKDDNSVALKSVSFVSVKADAAAKEFSPLADLAAGVHLTRDLINEPPNLLYPDSYAKIIRDELKPLGIDVEIFDEKKMEKLGFHSHLAVGVGSSRQPRVVVMRYKGKGAKSKKPLAFVGKGVTFDTGGYNIKPTGSMEDMKYDMAGSAVVVGLMKALAARKAKVDVVGIVGLAENMVSSTAYRASDIINSLSGKTIEVLNTDAEGRLVLCDALTYVQQEYDPRLIVDLATLTGAMVVALGTEYCGVFANDDNLWKALDSAGTATGEKVWRMPLDEAFRKSMDSQVADIRNTSTMGRNAGACSAAGFLERFVDEGRAWAHMDIAGVVWNTTDAALSPKHANGFGVRLLDKMIADHYES